MAGREHEEKRLVLHFSWRDEPMLTRVSFRFPGLRVRKSGPHCEGDLVSEEDGSAFTWGPGPAALSILIVRSVAAALEGEKGFALPVPETKKGAKRRSGASDYPGQTLSNLLKGLGSRNSALASWAWRVFGVDRGGKKSQLVAFVTKVESRVRILWNEMSPITDIVVRCNGKPLENAADLRHLADEIEFRHFEKSRKAKSTIPRRRAELLGREDACEEIERLLISGPLVTLVGAGGCGKTDLCYEVARLIGHRYSAVRLIELADVNSGADRSRLEVEVARGLSTELMKGQQPTVRSIAKHIGRKRLLLVLDNCEHLRGLCKSLLDELLDDAALRNLRVLATSREAIGCRGEKVFDVDGLAYPPRGLKVRCMEDLTPYASVGLFRHKARAFSAEDDDAGALAEICRTLEGMPYAIELVAAQTNKRSLKGIAKAITDILPMGLPHAKHEHQQLIEASHEWSYRLLEDDEPIV